MFRSPLMYRAGLFCAGRLVALLCFALATLCLMPTPARAGLPESAYRGESHFTDGQWQLYLTPSLRYVINRAAIRGTAHWRMTGTGSFAVRRAVISEGGRYSATGAGGGDITFDSGAGSFSGTTTMSGKVVGSATSAKLTGEGALAATIHGTVRGTSFSVPMNYTGPIDPPAHLEIFSGSCDTVSGSFTLQYEAILNANGLTTSGQGRFTAIRVGEPGVADDTASDLGRKVMRLMGELGRLTEAASRGVIETAPILAVLARAEELQAELPTVRGECRSSLPWYTSVIAPAVHDLLAEIVEHAGDLPADKLAELISDGYRTGAIGGDAASSRDLELKYQDALGEALDRAIAANDNAAIAAIELAATEFGWNEIAGRARGAR